MFIASALTALVFVARVLAQQVGTQLAETHPSLPIQQCTSAGSCTTLQTSIVLDSNWRWVHNTGGYTNCYTGNKWSTDYCSDPVKCAQNCALDGADYSGTYGITTSGNALTLKFKTNDNVGSRVYLLASDSKYQMFKMMNQEFTFDVDMSKLDCGLNGAVYFSAMDEDGGMSKYTNNKAGAKYGTGYCDSQCPQDIKFINGEANIINWNGTSTNSGTGKYGTCCAEMDIWEANFNDAAYTPHPCTTNAQTRCDSTTTDCGSGSGQRYAGICDKDGCDFNSYRMGNKDFLGPGKTVDTTKPFTIVTQFIGSGSTLSEIKRYYVQGGKVIPNSQSTISGVSGNSLTDSWCAAQKTAFGDTNSFQSKGGMAQMGKALANGMVLALSLWDDYAANMLWLDSNYPTDRDTSQPGTVRGPCATTSGKPADVESQQASAQVIYSNIKFGPINSTFTQ